MMCCICDCGIDQEEADIGAEIVGPGHDAICGDCAADQAALHYDDLAEEIANEPEDDDQ